MGHFSITASAEQLKQAAAGYRELGSQLANKASMVRETPGQIDPKQWSGGARDAITAEMTGLGDQMSRFSGMFDAASTALTTVADKVDVAQTSTIPALNRRWDDAQTAYQESVGKANSAYDHDSRGVPAEVTGTARSATMQGLQQTRQGAVDQAEAVRGGAEKQLNQEFNQLVTDLGNDFKRCGETLATSTVVQVPDETVAGFLAAGGTGATMTWSKDGRTFPPQLGTSRALAGSMPLTDHRQAQVDGEKVAGALDAWTKDTTKPPQPLDPEIQGLMDARSKDPYFGQAVATKLGPEGVLGVMRKARDLVAPAGFSENNPTYAVDDPTAELKRLRGIQDQMGTWMSGIVASGSMAPGGLPKDFGTKMVEKDAYLTGIIFKYGDQQNLAFGGQFMHEAGTALVKEEVKDPTFFRDQYEDDTYGYGTTANSNLDRDPTRWFLMAADNGVESAQAVMGDEALLKYFLVDQNTWDGRDAQAGNVLRVATIDHALDPVPPGTDPHQSTAWKAAQISSMTLNVVGEGAVPVEGVKKTVAGIIAVYMADVDRASQTSDIGVGVYDHTTAANSWPAGVNPGDGWPQFGIKIDKADLRDILTDIGGDKESREIVGRTAALYNLQRLKNGAADSVGWNATDGESPFIGTARESTQLQGFLVDSMSLGALKEAKDEAEARARTAEAFMIPLDYVAVDALGPLAAPLATVAIDKAKAAVTDAYVGSIVDDAYNAANDDWETTRDETKLQVLEAARVNGLLTESEMRSWPVDEKTGEPVPLLRLTEEQRVQVLQNMGKGGGNTQAALGAVENGQNDYTQRYVQ